MLIAHKEILEIIANRCTYIGWESTRAISLKSYRRLLNYVLQALLNKNVNIAK